MTGAALALALGGGAAAQEARKPSPIPADARIIFASDRDHETDEWGLGSNALYVADLAGHVTRITHARYFHNHFTVSPDRRYIATNRYSRGDTNKDGKYFPLNDYKELWVVDTVAGTERRLVPEIDAGWGGLAWSPDGRWIYFSSPSGQGKGMDLRRVEVATGKVETLTANLLKLLGVEGERKFVSDVSASPDGQSVVFLYTGPEMLASGQSKTRIAVMKLDGSEAHIVTDGGPLPAGKRGVWSTGDFDPEFSPDSGRITFARVTDRGMVSQTLSTFDIMTVKVDGTDLKDISPITGGAAEFIPSWGDDGRIVFTRLAPAEKVFAPVVYDPATGARTPISIAGEGSHVQWIPSGKASR
jgi:Tol biopolymer transport system component